MRVRMCVLVTTVVLVAQFLKEEHLLGDMPLKQLRTSCRLISHARYRSPPPPPPASLPTHIYVFITHMLCHVMFMHV